MMIGEEHLAGGLTTSAPEIEIQKTDVVEMQDLRPVFPHDVCQIPARLSVTIRRVCQHFKGNVRQIEKAPHLGGWFGKKAQHALPSSLAQLERELARKGLSAADAKRLNAKNRNQRRRVIGVVTVGVH